MPSLQRQRKAYKKRYYLENRNQQKQAQQNRRYYVENTDQIKAAVKALYQADPKKKKAASRALYRAQPDRKKAAVRALYRAQPDKKKAAVRALYRAQPDRKKAAVRALYRAEPDRKKAAVRALYRAEPDRKKAAVRALYRAQPDRKKAAVRALYRAQPDRKKATVRALYRAQPDRKKAAVRALYRAQPDRKKTALRALYRAQPDRKKAASSAYFSRNQSARKMYFRKYYASHKDDICLVKRARYALAEPKPAQKGLYLKNMQANLLRNFEARTELTNAFKKLHESIARRMPRVLRRTVCRLAARRLLHKTLQLRKEHVGSLLRSIRSIKAIQITQKEDFGNSCHSMSTKPYFYASYQPVKRNAPIPINEAGQCVIANEICTDKEDAQKKKWECSSECKPVTDTEVNAILTFKAAFENPIQKVRHALDTCDDGCPNGHYYKVTEFSSVGLKGHPLVCSSSSGGCQSKLRVLRAASTHFPVLRQFLHDVHSAIRSHMCVFEIDKALCAANCYTLMEITNVEKLETLLSNDVESSYEQSTDVKSALRQPSLETNLFITHAGIIAQLEKEINDFPEYVCCSCERLHQRKSVTVVKLSDNLGHGVWPRLKSFILQQNPDAGDHILYMCKYCKPMIKRDRLPPRCVLNGLQTVPIPQELATLDPLSRQLIQRAKCYQTIVRLGTYTAKVPIYNSLKACKGTVFFLPLPLNKTLETLDQVEQCGGAYLILSCTLLSMVDQQK